MQAVIFERPSTIMEKMSAAYTIFVMLTILEDLNSSTTTYLQHLLFACGLDVVDRSPPPIVDLAKHDYNLDNGCKLLLC